MGNVLMIWRLCIQNFRKWTANPRIYVLAILMLIHFYFYSPTINNLCRDMEFSITPYLFPLVVKNIANLNLIMLALVLLFCDAPFLDEEQPYILIRAGKKRWMAGQVLYLALASLVYFVFIQVATLLFCLQSLEFDMEWGGTIIRIANKKIPPDLGYNVNFPVNLIEAYDPLNGLLLNTGIAVLVGVMLGLIMFALNIRFNRAIGALGASAVVLTSSLDLGNPNVSIYFRPVAWIDMGNLNLNGLSSLPSVEYVLAVLGIAILGLSILCYLLVRKKNIEVMPQI